MFKWFLRFWTNTNLGLKPQKIDDRDLEVGLLWGWLDDYKPNPKHKKLIPREAKDQFCNTCGWNATTGMKEIDENEELDERTLVMFGKELGYISGDGFSTLRNNQKTLLKRGIAPINMLPGGRKSWSYYSNPKHLTPEIRTAATDRRIKSYLSITSINGIYKAIDEGRPVEIGVGWYTGWQGSGFKLPWIVYKIIGWLIGGHAMYVYDYDLNYKGQKVFIVRNSFGKAYGNNGDLYMTPEMLAPNIRKYGAFINYDLDVDILGWLKIHQGQVVKGENNKDVYLIQGDTKRKYETRGTLMTHGKNDADIVIVAQDILDKIKKGKIIDFWSGGNVKQVKELARFAKSQDPELLKELKMRFNELF